MSMCIRCDLLEKERDAAKEGIKRLDKQIDSMFSEGYSGLADTRAKLETATRALEAVRAAYFDCKDYLEHPYHPINDACEAARDALKEIGAEDPDCPETKKYRETGI